MATNKSTIKVRVTGSGRASNIQPVTDNANLRIFKLRKIQSLDSNGNPIFEEAQSNSVYTDEDTIQYIYYSGSDVERKLYDIDQKLPVITSTDENGNPTVIASNLHANKNLLNDTEITNNKDTLVINKGYTDKFFIPYTGTPGAVSITTTSSEATASISSNFDINKVLSNDLYKSSIITTASTQSSTRTSSEVPFNSLSLTDQERILNVLNESYPAIYNSYIANKDEIAKDNNNFKIRIGTAQGNSYQYDHVLTTKDIAGFATLKNISTNKDYAARAILNNSGQRIASHFTLKLNQNETIDQDFSQAIELGAAQELSIKSALADWPNTLSGYDITDAKVEVSNPNDAKVILGNANLTIDINKQVSTASTISSSTTATVALSASNTTSNIGKAIFATLSTVSGHIDLSLGTDSSTTSTAITLSGEDNALNLTIAGITKNIALTTSDTNNDADGIKGRQTTVEVNSKSSTLSVQSQNKDNTLHSIINLDGTKSDLAISSSSTSNNSSFNLTLSNISGSTSTNKTFSAALSTDSNAATYATLSINGTTASFAKIANTGVLTDIADGSAEYNFKWLEDKITGRAGFNDVILGTDSEGKPQIEFSKSHAYTFAKIAATGSLTDITDKANNNTFSKLEKTLTGSTFSDVSITSATAFSGASIQIGNRRLDFGKVATSNDYRGLANTPTISLDNDSYTFNGFLGSTTSAIFSKVAATGNYKDLASQPTLTISSSNNDSWAVLNGLKISKNDTTFSGSLALAKIANTGNFAHIKNLPPQLALTINGLGALATVSLGGNALTDKYFPNAVLNYYTFSNGANDFIDINNLVSTTSIPFINLLTSEPDNTVLSILPFNISVEEFNTLLAAAIPETQASNDSTIFNGGYQGFIEIPYSIALYNLCSKLIDKKNKIVAVRLEPEAASNTAVDGQFTTGTNPYILLNVSSINPVYTTIENGMKLELNISFTGFSSNSADIKYEAHISLNAENTIVNNENTGTASGSMKIYWRKATDSIYTSSTDGKDTHYDINAKPKYENAAVSEVLNNFLAINRIDNLSLSSPTMTSLKVMDGKIINNTFDLSLPNKAGTIALTSDLTLSTVSSTASGVVLAKSLTWNGTTYNLGGTGGSGSGLSASVDGSTLVIDNPNDQASEDAIKGTAALQSVSTLPDATLSTSPTFVYYNGGLYCKVASGGTQTYVELKK